jgi:SAM-dependent methyltransferase
MNLKGGKPERFGSVTSFLYRRWGQPSLEPLHRRIASEIPADDGRLLDVGCGPGQLDRLLARAHPQLTVVALDGSPAMVRQAMRGAPLPNLEFRQGTIEEAGFREEFGFALSVLSFHHWEEPVEGLDAVARALKPNGRFWIYEADPEAPIEEIRRDEAPLWGWLRLPEKLVRRGLSGHGFTLAEVDRVLRPVIAQSAFLTCDVHRTGSTLRIALTKAP